VAWIVKKLFTRQAISKQLGTGVKFAVILSEDWGTRGSQRLETGP
jgi:hypothetical protein